jgi:guanosine-3',5'-bis(diphosphate) 3'-pyrophosphohydrolase
MPTIEDVVSVAKKNEPNTDEKRIRDAYAFAQEAHEKQSRASGEPYVIHALATAARLAEMKLPSPIVIAGLLHDVPEETNKTLEEISERFGSDVAGMVAGVTKLGRLKYRGIERYVENLRNMFLSLAKDMRVIIIKFADRLHNLETLNAIAGGRQL